ncbi:MAG: hypothetical protein GXO78_09680 [Calditrichaeota bacterium]|nr:hypothetical protein [Calditrichota bacterium]
MNGWIWPGGALQKRSPGFSGKYPPPHFSLKMFDYLPNLPHLYDLKSKANVH